MDSFYINRYNTILILHFIFIFHINRYNAILKSRIPSEEVTSSSPHGDIGPLEGIRNKKPYAEKLGIIMIIPWV